MVLIRPRSRDEQDVGVLFSHDIFSAQPVGGISRCMIEVMAALGSAGGAWHLWAGDHYNRLLDAAVDEPSFGRHVAAARLRPPRGRYPTAVLNEVRFARYVAATRPPVVHRTYYSALDLTGRGRRPRRVETLHDMWDERAGSAGNTATRLRSAIKRRALERADAIICVSHSTKAELLEIAPHLADRVAVVHHGVRRLSAKPSFVAPRPFFLFVGQRGTYKNFAVAVAGLAHAGLVDHDLVCFGGGAFTAAERDIIAAHGVTDRVCQRNGDDDALAGAYEAAAALVFPSRYEGFGLPVLEAMSHGCLVIAAPLTALPEVGGGAAVYADPTDAAAWANAMRDAVLDPDPAGRRERGRRHAATFTWERSAAEHRRIYDALA